MVNDYINNFQNILSNILFASFKYILILLITALIFSLIMLAIGCLIKSQKIKSKFLIAAPSLILALILLLCFPIIFIYIKNLI